MDRYLEVGRNIIPFALYLHVELEDEDIAELLRVCNSESEPPNDDASDDEEKEDEEEGCVRLAPTYKFFGQPLRTTYDKHIKDVAPGGVFDPMCFVAVVERDWRSKGVLLVTLDTEDVEGVCTVGKMGVKAEKAGLYLVNLQIANVMWADYMEEVEEGSEGEGEGGGGGEDEDES